MGLRQPRVGASTKALRRCIGAEGWLENGIVVKETTYEGVWKGRGEDVAMMIEQQ